MLTGLKLRAALFLSAVSWIAACSLDPQPEPPMMEDGVGGMIGGDAAASYGGSGGSAGSSSGLGGSAGSAAGTAGAAGGGLPDASADAPCTGDNCFCEGLDGGCDAACEADCEGGCDDADAPDDDAADDAPDAGDPTDGAGDDDALGAETGP